MLESWKSIFVTEDQLTEKCQDIWNNTKKYSQYEPGTEDAYYKFLKFLWIDKYNQSSIRLGDLVTIHTR
jgi:hypothetical protein